MTFYAACVFVAEYGMASWMFWRGALPVPLLAMMVWLFLFAGATR